MMGVQILMQGIRNQYLEMQRESCLDKFFDVLFLGLGIQF